MECNELKLTMRAAGVRYNIGGTRTCYSARVLRTRLRTRMPRSCMDHMPTSSTTHASATTYTTCDHVPARHMLHHTRNDQERNHGQTNTKQNTRGSARTHATHARTIRTLRSLARSMHARHARTQRMQRTHARTSSSSRCVQQVYATTLAAHAHATAYVC